MASTTDMAAPLDQKHDSTPQKTHPKTDLQKDEFRNLWYRLRVFVYDLRTFNTDPTARSRLDSVTDPAYLGPPYFSNEEVSLLKSTEIGPGEEGEESLGQRIQSTLEERLNRRMEKRVESADFRVCAAHDLAPIFEKAFDINPKKLAKDAKFMALVQSNGQAFSDGENARIFGNPFESKVSGNKAKKMQKQQQKKKGR